MKMYNVFERQYKDVNNGAIIKTVLSEKELIQKLDYYSNHPIYEIDNGLIMNLIFNKPVLTYSVKTN